MMVEIMDCLRHFLVSRVGSIVFTFCAKSRSNAIPRQQKTQWLQHTMFGNVAVCEATFAFAIAMIASAAYDLISQMRSVIICAVLEAIQSKTNIIAITHWLWVGKPINRN